MKYPSDRVFEAVQTTRCATCFRARLHEGGGPPVGEVTCGGKLPHLTCIQALKHVVQRVV